MSLLCHHRWVTDGFQTCETMLHQLVTVLTKINGKHKRISMEVVTQEDTHIRPDYIIVSSYFFPQNLQLFAHRSARLTGTH